MAASKVERESDREREREVVASEKVIVGKRGWRERLTSN